MQFWCIAIPLEKSTPVELLLVYRYHYIRLHRKTRIGITFPTLVRSRTILNGLHYEYWLEKAAD
jgi:hypothetical protein